MSKGAASITANLFALMLPHEWKKPLSLLQNYLRAKQTRGTGNRTVPAAKIRF